MTLSEKINQDYIAAFKNRQTDTVNVLRLIKGALKNEEINLGHPLEDTEAQAVLNKEAKKRRESIDLYTQAGRAEQAAGEQAELEVIESYLPKAMSDDELQAVVDSVLQETGATQKSDMGKVMGSLKAKLENPADISKAAALVSQKLN